MLDCLPETQNCFLQSDEDFCSEIIAVSFEVRMGNFLKLKYDVTWSSNHSFISHIGVSEFLVAGCSCFDFESEFLDSGNDLLFLAEVALSSDDFSFSTAARTSLGKQVVVSSS